MVMEFFRRSRGGSTIGEVAQLLVTMLDDGLTVYEAATEAVFGAGKSKETKQTVKSTDRGINRTQQNIRRALVMHSSVSTVDLPVVLAYMSIVKDAERVGDHAKNLYDLARWGVDFSTAPDSEELLRYRDAVSGLIVDTRSAFAENDEEEAQRLIGKADGFLADHQGHVEAAYHSDGPASDAVARALYFRYLKRITAHLMNMLTALVMPLDQLDYYDEAPDDRSEPAE